MQETIREYEGAIVLPPIRGLSEPTITYYLETGHHAIWSQLATRYITSKKYTINNCVKDDCVEHFITDSNNKIQSRYITSKPNIDSKQKILNEKMCSICMEDFDINNNTLDDCCLNKCCSNHFHISCINKWILNNFKQNKQPSCPLCRKSFETSPNPFPTISNDIDARNITETETDNLINILINSQDIEIYSNQIDIHSYDIYVRSFCVASQINNETFCQIIHRIHNSNEFLLGSANYKYEFNLETKIYSIYNLDTGELKMTLRKCYVDLVMQRLFCSLKRAISRLVEFSGDIISILYR